MIDLNWWEKTELIETLKGVKSNLKKGGFICIAIEKRCGFDNWQSWYLRTWINQMLDDVGTYEGWYLDNFGTFPTIKQAYENRIKWLDWMIEELQK